MGNSIRPILRLLAGGLVAVIMASCAGSGSMTETYPMVVAVWDLEDLSVQNHGQAGMGEMLAGQIAARIGEAEGYQVVERQQLLRAIEELHLGSSALAESDTRLRLGRMIGARQMIFGAFLVAGQTMRVDLRQVDVASGKIVATTTAESAAGDLAGWLQAADRAAAGLVAE